MTVISVVKRGYYKLLNPFPYDKFLESSKLTEFADYNFKLDENNRQFSKRMENTVGKGEIARNERFLPVWITFFSIFVKFEIKLSSANSFSLEV